MRPLYMRPKFNEIAFLALSAVMAATVASGCGKAEAQVAERPASTYTLTIYKDDFALVHDVRQVKINAGASDLRVPGVSKQLDPSSVLFDWPNGGDHPEVVSTIYNTGVASSQDLLKRMVGQDVTVVYRGQNGEVGDRLEGRLEEAGQGTVLHTKDSYVIDPSGEIHAPADKTIVTMPELVATVQSTGGGDRPVGISYLTRGLSWSADYVGVLNGDGKTMRLECWGTIGNQTGTTFSNAKLKLVAGSPNRAALNLQVFAHESRSDSNINMPADMGLMQKARVPASIAPRATGDLYTYDLPDTASIGEGQMNRARISTVEQVPVVRNYSVSLSEWLTASERHTAQVSISFTNEKHSGLGFPLPAGTLRAYENDGDAKTYVGAADIGDTPKDERVALTLSNAFDVFVKAHQNSEKRVTKRKVRRAYTIELHNEKKTPAEIRVVQSFDEQVQPEDQTVPPKKLGYNTLEWKVTVPAGSVKTLQSTVVLGK